MKFQGPSMHGAEVTGGIKNVTHTHTHTHTLFQSWGNRLFQSWGINIKK